MVTVFVSKNLRANKKKTANICSMKSIGLGLETLR